MSHDELIRFFVQLALMLAVALLCGQAMRRIGQPAVLGELIGGILLGPTVLGTLAPDSYAALFADNATVAVARDAVLRLGMLFFLFVAGLEVNLAHVRARGGSILSTSLLGVLLPFALGFGAVWAWPEWWQAGASSDGGRLALFMGTALSISALPVIARTLMDLKLLQSEMGVVILTAATIDDLIGWSLFALLLRTLTPDTAEGGAWATLGLMLAVAVGIVGVGRWLVLPLLPRLRARLPWPSGFIALVTILVLGAAALAESIGLHAVFGAYLVGVALSQGTEETNEAHEIIYQFAVSFFAPLYFVSLGMRANFAAHFDLPLVLVVLLVACVGKIVGAGLGARLGGMPPRVALAVGFGLNARGAIEMILASIALEAGLIGERLFVALIVMALVTSIISGPALRILMRPNPPPTPEVGGSG